MNEQEKLHKELQKRFTSLPKTLQDAITSAEVEEHLRELASKNKLHLDQWQKLENEVTMTLLGLQSADNLPGAIQKHVGVSRDIAEKLSHDIGETVFRPIRSEMERILEGSQPGEVHSTEDSKAEGANSTKTQPAGLSERYRPGEISAVRKDIESDPYREPVD